MEIDVRAQLRPATQPEVVEALERNPGSRRLAERGWTPLWFEVHVGERDGEISEHIFSVVWREPGAAASDLARDELELALEEALRNLRDLEGVDVWREDVPADAITVLVDPDLEG